MPELKPTAAVLRYALPCPPFFTAHTPPHRWCPDEHWPASVLLPGLPLARPWESCRQQMPESMDWCPARTCLTSPVLLVEGCCFQPCLAACLSLSTAGPGLPPHGPHPACTSPLQATTLRSCPWTHALASCCCCRPSLAAWRLRLRWPPRCPTSPPLQQLASSRMQPAGCGRPWPLEVR